MEFSPIDSRLAVCYIIITTMAQHFRNIVNILIAAMLFIASAGIPVIHHFCMGDSDGVSVFVKKSCCEGAAMPKNCCNDNVTLQQLNDDGLAPGVLMPAPSLSMLALLPPVTSPSLKNGHDARPVMYVDTSPPVHTDIPIFVRSLLI
jgi:hypothetical protein